MANQIWRDVRFQNVNANPNSAINAATSAANSLLSGIQKDESLAQARIKQEADIVHRNRVQDWNEGEEGRRRALNSERAIDANRIWEEEVAAQGQALNLNGSKLFDEQFDKIHAKGGNITSSEDVNLVRENGGYAGAFRPRGERESAEDYAAAQKQYSASNPLLPGANTSMAEARDAQTGSKVQNHIDSTNAEILSKPGLYVDPIKAGAEMTNQLRMAGYAEDKIAPLVESRLAQYWPKADPAVVTAAIKEIGDRKNTLEKYGDYILPKQGTLGSSSANSVLSDSMDFQSNLIKNNKYVSEWMDDESFKKGSRQWWNDGIDVGNPDIFEDAVPKYLQQLNQIGISSPEAITMLETVMTNKTTKFDITKLNPEQLDMFRNLSQDPGVRTGSSSSSQSGGSGAASLASMLELDAAENTQKQKEIMALMQSTQRRKADTSNLGAVFSDEGQLAKSDLGLSGNSNDPIDLALNGVNNLPAQTVNAANGTGPEVPIFGETPVEATQPALLPEVSEPLPQDQILAHVQNANAAEEAERVRGMTHQPETPIVDTDTRVFENPPQSTFAQEMAAVDSAGNTEIDMNMSAEKMDNQSVSTLRKMLAEADKYGSTGDRELVGRIRKAIAKKSKQIFSH